MLARRQRCNSKKKKKQVNLYAAELLGICMATTVKDQQRDAYVHRYNDVMLRGVWRYSRRCLTSCATSSVTRRHIRCDQNEVADDCDDGGCHTSATKSFVLTATAAAALTLTNVSTRCAPYGCMAPESK